MSLEKKFEWCIKKGKGERKHKGIRKIKPDREEVDNHVGKAVHNLEAMIKFKELGSLDDWVVSAAFYSMYHACLAVLYELGYESRNQECTITALEYFIEKGKIKLEKDYIWMIRRTEELRGKTDTKTLREEFQYGTETRVNPNILGEVMGNAKKFVQRVRVLIEEMRRE